MKKHLVHLCMFLSGSMLFAAFPSTSDGAGLMAPQRSQTQPVTPTRTFPGVRLAPAVTALTLNPNSLFPGQTTGALVTLERAAGASGAVINLASTTPGVTVPPNITVAPGATSATFMVMVQKTALPGNAVISATSNAGTAMQAVLGIMSDAQVRGVQFYDGDLCTAQVRAGYTCQAVVILDKQAPAGGLTVNLSASSPPIGVAGGVNVAAGASSAVFPVTIAATAQPGQATLSAVRGGPGGVTKQMTFTILPPPKLESLTVTKGAEPGGTISGTIKLDGVAPQTGMNVMLASSSPSITVPANITFAGRSQATFTGSVLPNASAGDVTIGALIPNSGSGGKDGVVKITIAQVYNLFFVQPEGYACITCIFPGRTSTGNLVLGTYAGSPVTVNLSSSSPDVTVPASVTIPAGAVQTTFTATARTSAAPTNVTISAVRAGAGNVTKQGTLELRPVEVYKVELPANSNVKVGESRTGTITLEAPADPGGMVVKLRVANAYEPAVHVSVPSSITVPAGQKTATYTYTGTSVGNGTNIKAVRNGSTREVSAPMNISVFPGS